MGKKRCETKDNNARMKGKKVDSVLDYIWLLLEVGSMDLLASWLAQRPLITVRGKTEPATFLQRLKPYIVYGVLRIIVPTAPEIRFRVNIKRSPVAPFQLLTHRLLYHWQSSSLCQVAHQSVKVEKVWNITIVSKVALVVMYQPRQVGTLCHVPLPRLWV